MCHDNSIRCKVLGYACEIHMTAVVVVKITSVSEFWKMYRISGVKCGTHVKFAADCSNVIDLYTGQNSILTDITL